MKIAVLGTGNVGRTIGKRLVALGHEVRLGSRTKDNEQGAAWAAANGDKASCDTFAGAARFGEWIFNCTLGAATLDALRAAGEDAIADKLLIDVSNPLDFSGGMPPTLSVFGTDSLGEQIQRAFPRAKVIKSLNTINCDVMVDPARVPGSHVVFMSGNDADAKRAFDGFLREQFGWKDVLDLGDIGTARGTEAYLLFWLRLWGALKTADFNVMIARAAGSAG
ncbi:MAG: NAD(P)-binding domain-containing protein [Polyangiaceae bacterium]|nr:NAD(P)-binding domain-containing protein [Polyangiaceae bacterium]